MKCIVSRIVDGEAVARIVLHRGERVSVGKSDSADLRIEDDVNLADVHFLLEIVADSLEVGNQPAPKRSLYVNGRKVTKATLSSGDTIRAGRSEFQVEIEAGTTTWQGPGLVDADAPPESIAPPPIVVRRRPAIKGVSQILVADGDIHRLAITKSLGTDSALFLVANFQYARAPLPPDAGLGEDLFQGAPAEIRASHSLHLLTLPPDRLDALAPLIDRLQKKDSAVIVCSTKSADELRKDHQLYWAWFARPSTLTLQFLKGSEQLATHLLTGFSAILMPIDASGQLPLFVPEEHASAIAEALAKVNA
ncbi:MAG: FHA domain-containing protein [Planctomycetota bacterium]|nr:FHA domain-containing protein [Planctomycetota bacterium]